MTTAADNHKLNQSPSSVAQFLANFNHELRTPMIGILGFIDLLEHTVLNREQRSNVDSMRECGEQLLHTIDEILEAAKIETGLVVLSPVPTDITCVLKKTVDIHDRNLIEKGLLLELDIDPSLSLPVMIDPYKFQQIINNLLANAIKFTHRGGIKITARVEFCPPARRLLVSVADTGIGIAEDQLENIFGCFTQADGSSSRPFGGTGIGLYICKRIIEMMDGEIWVDSQKGMGSTFSFIVPLVMSWEEGQDSPLAAAIDDSEADDLVVGFGPVPILLVEDNELNQKLIAQMLSNYGFEVVIAANGLECLSLLQRKPIDVVLMDMQMPIMNGYEATRLIRENPKWQSIPIIAITANSTSEDREKCLACGCSSYLAKPFKSETLVKEIKRYLRNRFVKENNTDNLAQQLIADLLPEFIEMLGETLQELREALENRDLKCIKDISHSLKGTAGMYGFMQISELAAHIQKATEDKNYPRMHNLYQQILSFAQQLQVYEKSQVVV